MRPSRSKRPSGGSETDTEPPTRAELGAPDAATARGDGVTPRDAPIPDIAQLALQVEQSAGPDDVDESAPTDYYHSVKPRPPAVPIAEVGAHDELLVEPPRPRRAWAVVLVAAGLTGLAVAIGFLRPLPAPTAAGSRGAQDPGAARTPSVTKAPARGRDEPGVRRDDVDEVPRPSAARSPDARGVRVAFERHQNAIVVPVRVQGPAGAKLFKLVFDTGATYSTLTTKALSALGVEPSGVKGEVSTANGVVRRPLAVVDAMALAHAEIKGGLTIGVCERCSTEQTEGLLGLNFSRHFLVTVDHDQAQLLLTPRAARDKTLDVRPFIELVGAKSQRLGERIAIDFTVRNRSARAVKDLLIQAEAPGLSNALSTTIPQLPARAERAATIVGLLAGNGPTTFTLDVARADW